MVVAEARARQGRQAGKQQQQQFQNPRAHLRSPGAFQCCLACGHSRWEGGAQECSGRGPRLGVQASCRKHSTEQPDSVFNDCDII